MRRAFDPSRPGDGGWRALLWCLIGRHARLGRAVTWDGYDFRSLCRHCGAPLYKHGNVRWRRVRLRRNVPRLTYVPDTAPWPDDPPPATG